MTDTITLHAVDRALRQAIAELSLVSHGPTMSFDPSPRDTSDEPGGRRPGRSDGEPRPRDEADFKAWEASYHRKTPAWFRRRRETALQREDVGQLEALRDDARECVEAWRKQPPMIGVVEEIEVGSFLWKCQVADDDSGTIKNREDRYGISAATIHRYRAQYRGLQRKRAA